jgi:hypothetical protein
LDDEYTAARADVSYILLLFDVRGEPTPFLIASVSTALMAPVHDG